MDFETLTARYTHAQIVVLGALSSLLHPSYDDAKPQKSGEHKPAKKQLPKKAKDMTAEAYLAHLQESGL